MLRSCSSISKQSSTAISYKTSLALVMPPEVPRPLLPLPQATTVETIESSSVPRPPPAPTMTTRSLGTSLFLPILNPLPTLYYHLPSLTLQAVERTPFLCLLQSRLLLPRLRPHSRKTRRRARNRRGSVKSEDDELAVLNLPFPNTTPVRLAHMNRLLAQARQRQREIERQDARRLRGGSFVNRQGRHRGEGGDGDESGGERGDSDARVGRIPGAIEEDEED